MINQYNQEYYMSNNYSNYLERENRYIQMSKELDDLFYKINLINKNSRILDYGCAVGFLIKSFKALNYSNIYGYDISEWAIDFAKKNNCNIIDNVINTNFDLVFFLDVLEHMQDQEIENLFNDNNFDKIIIRIPCAEDSDPNNFFLDISKKDITHINCKTKKKWIKLFKKFGYNHFFKLNLNTIYDSQGCFCCFIIK